MSRITTLEHALERDLPAFLPDRRWFGAKARAIATVEVEDLVPVAATDDAGPWIALARVTFDHGPAERYALLVRVRADTGDLPRIGRVETGGAWLVEAAGDPASALALLATLESGAGPPSPRGARLLGGDRHPGRDGAFAPSALAPAEVRLLGAEQSNSSIRLGTRHVFKMFRRLEPGENPELEVGRFLTARTSFRAMAAVRGSITLAAADGSRATLGVVQQWIDNSGDGWRWTLEALDAAASDPAALAPLAAEIERLGEVTAAFHLASASDPSDAAFAPEPLDDRHRDAWSEEHRARAARARTLLGATRADLPVAAREVAHEILERGRLGGPAAAPSGAAFVCIRIHGDYHLGQTLRGGSGWVLVDFEGEPARTLAERRAKHAALKDVAGMLRSIDYAAETARRHRAARGDTSADAVAIAAPLREAFLRGYRTSAADAPFLPRDAAGFGAWLDFFELDKAIYELEYELNHRPEWVGIPLDGIARIQRAREGRA